MFKRKKPIDSFQGLTEEEKQRKLDEFADSDFERGDMTAIILAALRVFIPPILLLFLAIYLLAMLFM